MSVEPLDEERGLYHFSRSLLLLYFLPFFHTHTDTLTISYMPVIQSMWSWTNVSLSSFLSLAYLYLWLSISLSFLSWTHLVFLFVISPLSFFLPSSQSILHSPNTPFFHSQLLSFLFSICAQTQSFSPLYSFLFSLLFPLFCPLCPPVFLFTLFLYFSTLPFLSLYLSILPFSHVPQ